MTEFDLPLSREREAELEPFDAPGYRDAILDSLAQETG